MLVRLKIAPFVRVGGNALICSLLFVLLFSCNNSRPGGSDHPAWADRVVERFRRLMTAGDSTRAIIYLDSAYQATPDRGSGDYWKKYNAKIERYWPGDAMQARLLLDSMKMILKGRELKYTYEYAHTLMVQGDWYLEEKKYPEAFQSYYDGGNFARQNGDFCSLSDFSQHLGNIYYNQGVYDKAIAASKESYQQCSNCATSNYNDFRYRFELPQQVLNTIALSFERKNQPDSAVSYYLKALDFIDRQSEKFPEKVYMSVARAVIEGNLGGVYVKLHQYDNAVRFMKQSIRNNDREGYAIEDAQLTKTKLADLYISNHQLASADTLISQLYNDLRTGRGKSLAHDIVRGKWLYLKWQFNDRSRQFSEAYRYLQRYKAYTDSVSQDKSDLRSTDLDHAFKEHDQQFRLTLLSKNDELKTAYLIVVILFLLLATSVALITWYYLKRSRGNVTVLSRLNNQMANTLAALENSQADNSRMMAIVAHDLRNPISAMTMAAGAVIEDEKQLSADSYELLELIKTSGNNSMQLVNELLSVNSRPDQTGQKPEDLRELIQECVELLRHKATAKHQQLIIHAIPLIAEINREKMWRVISNLIANAIKFSPENKAITIRLEQKQQYALIVVEDEGIGIPSEHRDKIFEMSTPGKRKGTAGEESFGLGLAISRQIMEWHGGKIWFESTPGEGTLFYVELPLHSGGE